jgi:hypothetical protein
VSQPQHEGTASRPRDTFLRAPAWRRWPAVLRVTPERRLARSTPVQPCYDPPTVTRAPLARRPRATEADRRSAHAARTPCGRERRLDASPSGRDQHVLGECRQEPVAERATVRRRLEVGGRADAVPPCIDEPLRHAVIVPREQQSRMPVAPVSRAGLGLACRPSAAALADRVGCASRSLALSVSMKEGGWFKWGLGRRLGHRGRCRTRRPPSASRSDAWRTRPERRRGGVTKQRP